MRSIRGVRLLKPEGLEIFNRATYHLTNTTLVEFKTIILIMYKVLPKTQPMTHLTVPTKAGTVSVAMGLLLMGTNVWDNQFSEQV